MFFRFFSVTRQKLRKPTRDLRVNFLHWEKCAKVDQNRSTRSLTVTIFFNFFDFSRERVDRFWSTVARFSQCKKLTRNSRVGFRSFWLVTEKNRKNMKSRNFRLWTRKIEKFSTLTRKSRKFSSLDSKKPKIIFDFFESKVENFTSPRHGISASRSLTIAFFRFFSETR